MFFLLLLFLSLSVVCSRYSHLLSCLCTRSSNSSNNYFVLGRVPNSREYYLEIECRPMLRPVSMVNHGSLSIHTLPLVHFRHDTRLNIRLVVVSTKQEKKKHIRIQKKQRTYMCVCQLMIVEVTRCSHISPSSQTITIVFSSSSFLLLLGYFLSPFFCFLFEMSSIDSCFENFFIVS